MKKQSTSLIDIVRSIKINTTLVLTLAVILIVAAFIYIPTVQQELGAKPSEAGGITFGGDPSDSGTPDIGGPIEDAVPWDGDLGPMPDDISNYNSAIWPELAGSNRRHHTQYNVLGHASYSSYEQFGLRATVRITKHNSLIYGFNEEPDILRFYDVDTLEEKYNVPISNLYEHNFFLMDLVVTEDDTMTDQDGDGDYDIKDAILARENNIIYGMINQLGSQLKGAIFSVRETPNGAELLNIVDLSNLITPRVIVSSNEGIFVISIDGKTVNDTYVENDLRFFDNNLNEKWHLELENFYPENADYHLINGEKASIDNYGRLWIAPSTGNSDECKILVFDKDGNVVLNEFLGSGKPGRPMRIMIIEDKVYIFSRYDNLRIYDQQTLNVLWEGNTNPDYDNMTYGFSYNDNTKLLHVLNFSNELYKLSIRTFSTIEAEPQLLWEKEVISNYIYNSSQWSEPITDYTGNIYIFHMDDNTSGKAKILIMNSYGQTISDNFVLNSSEFIGAHIQAQLNSLIDRNGNLYHELFMESPGPTPMVIRFMP